MKLHQCRDKYSNIIVRPIASASKLVRYLHQDGTHGWCLGCGKHYTDNIKPNAKAIPCKQCGAKMLYGLQALFDANMILLE